MTRDEAVAFINDRLGDRTGLTTKIQNEIKVAQTRLEGSAELPWFLLTLNTSLVTVASTQTVAVPTGFLRAHEDIPLYLIDPDGRRVRLEKSSYDALEREPELDDPGQPSDYDLIGLNWYLFPIPDAVYSLRSFHYLADTVLSTNIENNWLKYAPGTLIGEAGYWIARYLRDPEATQYFRDYRDEDIRRMQIENEARKQASAAAFMGG